MANRNRWRVVGALASLALLASACGDDDDEAGDIEAYCELSRELDEQEDFPSEAQLDEIAELAPEEIKADVDFVVGKFKEVIEAGDPATAFEDEEIEARFETIEEFEAEECGIAGDNE